MCFPLPLNKGLWPRQPKKERTRRYCFYLNYTHTRIYMPKRTKRKGRRRERKRGESVEARYQ